MFKAPPLAEQSAAEKRLNRHLKEWVIEVVHNDPTETDDLLIAEMLWRLNEKILVVFKENFPQITDPI